MPRLLSFKELRNEGVNYSRSTIFRLEKAGEFPKRVPIGTHHVGWIQEEIQAHVQGWIDARSREMGALGSQDVKKRGGRPPRFPRLNS